MTLVLTGSYGVPEGIDFGSDAWIGSLETGPIQITIVDPKQPATQPGTFPWPEALGRSKALADIKAGKARVLRGGGLEWPADKPLVDQRTNLPIEQLVDGYYSKVLVDEIDSYNRTTRQWAMNRGSSATLPATNPTSRPANASTEELDRARAKIRAEVVLLVKGIEDAKDMDRRKELLAQAARRVPEWYAQLDVPPPDTTKADWLETVSWDIIPDADFQTMLAHQRKTMADMRVALPENATRRELLAAIKAMITRVQVAMLSSPPQPTSAPASRPATSPATSPASQPAMDVPAVVKLLGALNGPQRVPVVAEGVFFRRLPDGVKTAGGLLQYVGAGCLVSDDGTAAFPMVGEELNESGKLAGFKTGQRICITGVAHLYAEGSAVRVDDAEAVAYKSLAAALPDAIALARLAELLKDKLPADGDITMMDPHRTTVDLWNYDKGGWPGYEMVFRSKKEAEAVKGVTGPKTDVVLRLFVLDPGYEGKPKPLQTTTSPAYQASEFATWRGRLVMTSGSGKNWPTAKADILAALKATDAGAAPSAGSGPAIQPATAPATAPATQPADAALDAAAAKRIAALILLLGDDDSKKREAAQKALAASGPAAVPLLIEAIKDKDPERAERARLALGDIEDRFGRSISNTNPSGVSDGPTADATFTINEAAMVNWFATWHFNGGAGADPGTLSLKHADGTVYGPWQAVSWPGVGEAAKRGWAVEPKVIIKPGKYTVVDSDPKTWSHNAQSKNAGFWHIKMLPTGTSPLPPWGEPSVQVQARLKTSLKAAEGGIPELLVDVRTGKTYPFTVSSSEFLEIEVDGTWYVHSPDDPGAVPAFEMLNGEGSCHDWPLPLDLIWQAKEKPAQRLELSVGKHKIRVAIMGAIENGGGDVRAISNELAIEVTAPTTQSASQPAKEEEEESSR